MDQQRSAANYWHSQYGRGNYWSTEMVTDDLTMWNGHRTGNTLHPGHNPVLDIPRHCWIPNNIRTKITATSFPQNMGKDNTDQRKVRADALWWGHKKKLAIYVDVACAGNGCCTIAAVYGCGRTTSSTTVNMSSIVEAGEATIAMGMSLPDVKFVESDSKSATRSYSIGAINPTASRLLKPQDTIHLMWVPAHAGNPGNEAAQIAARAADNREVGSLNPKGRLEPMLTYHELTQFRKDLRRAYPFPSPIISRE